MRRLLAGLALLLAPVAMAQTFTVTVVTKTAAHPYFGQGAPSGFAIDGVEGAELTLQRGQTYTFQLEDVTGHAFYLSTSGSGGPMTGSSGSGAAPWTQGVTGTPAMGDATVTITVPHDAPAELWYQCAYDRFVGYRINVVDATSTTPPPDARALRLAVLHNPASAPTLAVTVADAEPVRVRVYDMRGRVVARLYDGPLAPGVEYHVRIPGLAPGAYLVRASSGTREAMQGVTVVR